MDEQLVVGMGLVIAAINWALDPDGNPGTNDAVDIISMSLGIRNPDPLVTLLLGQACDAAYNAGVVVIAGSGNDALTTPLEPAAYTNVVSVGGHNQVQTLYANSSGGVDLVAPGERVWAMDRWGEIENEIGRWYYYGTSMAAPHVSGLAALIIQHARDNNIEVSNGYVYEALRHSAVDLPLITDPIYEGKGKAWAAESLPVVDPNDGAIDLLANNWPIDFDTNFTAPKYERNTTAAYYTEADMTQDVNVINNTYYRCIYNAFKSISVKHLQKHGSSIVCS